MPTLALAATSFLPTYMTTVTIKQIAEFTGLSIRTVGRILSDNGSGTASHLHAPATRERVLAAARELGYRPNASAKSMRTGRFGCAALLQSSTSAKRSNLSSELYAGIDDALIENDLHLTIARLSDDMLDSEEAVPKILREWLADGLLINYNSEIPPALLDTLTRLHLPFVWINSKHDANAVWPDDFGAGRAATEALIARGHRRIAFGLNEGADSHYSAMDRYNGYARAMEAAGLTPQKLFFPKPATPDTPTSILPPVGWEDDSPIWRPEGAHERPTAIVAYMGYLANFLIYLTATHGLRAPRDFSLVTFEEYPFDSAGTRITSWLIPNYNVGQEAVRMLLTRIADPEHAPLPSCAVPFTPPSESHTVGPTP